MGLPIKLLPQFGDRYMGEKEDQEKKELDGGARGNVLRREWFQEQNQESQDDVIRRGFNDKFPTDAEKKKQLKDYK